MMGALKYLRIPLTLAVMAWRSLTGTVLASSSADLDAQAAHLRSYVDALRRMIADKGSPEARRADAQVEFVVVPSTFPFARSGRPGGRMRIEMSTQFRLLLVYFEELSLAVGGNPALGDCEIRYTGMLQRLYADNLSSISSGGPVRDVPAPEVSAVAMRDNCVALQRDLPVKASLRPFRDYQVNDAVAFAYLHELGHLVLGHKGVTDAIFAPDMSEEERMRAFLSGMKMSRAQEYAADRFAVRELARLGAHPLEVLSPPLNDMFIATSGFDCYTRLGFSHPDPAARMRNVINTIKATTFHPLKQLPHPEDADTLFADFLAFYARVDATLKCPDDDAGA